MGKDNSYLKESMQLKIKYIEEGEEGEKVRVRGDGDFLL